MKDLTWRFLRVWQRDRDVFLRLWKSEIPGIIAEPLFVILAMGLGLGAYVGTVGNTRYLEFLAPGIVASYAMFSASFECTYGSFVRMELQKTFEAIISTPLSVEDVVAGEIFWGATRSVITASAVLTVITAFGLVHSAWALLVLPLALLEGLMFASIAMVFTSLVPAIHTFNYFFTLFLTPMFFFSGVFFPLDSYPVIVQKLSWIAPLTPVVRLVRGLVQGRLEPGLLWGLLLILGVTVVFFCLSLNRMRRRLLK